MYLNNPRTIMATAFALLLGPVALTSHLMADHIDGHNDSDPVWPIPLPGEDVFDGGAILLHGIGPYGGTEILNTELTITYVSDGETPASDIFIEISFLSTTGFPEYYVTGADLGFGSGPGTFVGTISTDELNAVTTESFLFPPYSEIFIEIGSITGAIDGVGYFENSYVNFDVGQQSDETTLVDDFEDGANNAGWSFNVTNPDVIQPNGGNPSAWLRNDGIVSFAPILTTAPDIDGPLIGDLRAQGVTSMALDARTVSVEFPPVSDRQMTILLRDTKGTDGVDDDDYAYYVGAIIPQPGEGWLTYEFEIPSQSTDPLPTGWSGGWAGDAENFRPGIDWNDVITNVDRVEFWWIHPAYFAIFQGWDVGVDNVSVTYSEGLECDGDANGDGTVDPLDSGYVLARFGCPVGTGDANCDAADVNMDGAVDPLDSGYVLARFGECP